MPVAAPIAGSGSKGATLIVRLSCPPVAAVAAPKSLSSPAASWAATRSFVVPPRRLGHFPLLSLIVSTSPPSDSQSMAHGQKNIGREKVASQDRRAESVGGQVSFLSAHPEGLLVSVHVHPGVRKGEGLGGLYSDGQMALRLRKRPVNGAANQDALEEFAEALSLRKARVQLVSGHASRDKVFLISCSPAETGPMALALSELGGSNSS